MANKDDQDSVEWFNDTLDEITKDRKNTYQKRVMPKVGSMYLYIYDPKTKDKLPIWDTCPLVFPIDFYNDGFLGLNMHYLTPLARKKLLDSLKNLMLSNEKYNMNTRLEGLSYLLLKEYGSYFYKYQVCVKRYLYGHVRSSFFLIHPSQWDKVIMLPLARWEMNPKVKTYR